MTNETHLRPDDTDDYPDLGHLLDFEENLVYSTEQIIHAAESYGVTLSTERLQELTSLAATTREKTINLAGRFEDNNTSIFGQLYYDGKNGVSASAYNYLTIGGYDVPLSSRTVTLDFTPSGKHTADPKHASRVAHYGIEGLQNYAILVKAGITPRPLEMVGKTNDAMAKVTTRLGFKVESREVNSTKPDLMENFISADYEEAEQKFFSHETLKLDEALVKRLADQDVGIMALSSQIADTENHPPTT